jgi:membrane associated rhomboid family serine protease
MHSMDGCATPAPDPPRPGRAPDGPSLKAAFLAAAGFVAALWAILLLGRLLDVPLFRMGVFPRDALGLLGIISAPLVHGSALHLLANTPPLLVLGTALLYGYPRSALPALAGMWVGSGLGVWLFARASFHIGASGLTHGLMFFVFVIGILRRDRPAIALALLVFFLYGGMVWTIFPYDPQVSFEYHFFGAVSGVAMAIVLRRRDPPPPRKVYSWELEEEDEPLIGEAWRIDSQDGERHDEDAARDR